MEVLHVAQIVDVDRAKQSGRYRCDSLDSEGFIHCCKPDQLKGVLERYYSGAGGIVLMRIDSDQLQVKLVFENTVGGDELFPHVYGEIDMQAVTATEVIASVVIE